MNSPIDQLIDGIDYNLSRKAPLTKKQHRSKTPPAKKIMTVFKNEHYCYTLMEQINCQAQNYIQLLKNIRSELNTMIRQNDNNLVQINEHPIYLLFQFKNSGQLSKVLADKMFIDSLSEKIGEDVPVHELAKSIAIEIESKPILSTQDINEKLAKTALLKALVAFMNQENTQLIQSGLMTASQTGKLSVFINKLINKEKKIMHSMQAENQSLDGDNALLKQAKTVVNQQLRQLRKQFKTIHQQHPNDIPMGMIHIASKVSESLLQSQQGLHQAFFTIQSQLKGKLNLLSPLKL